MDPLGELMRLFEVTLLTDAGQGTVAALAPVDISSELPLGKLVTAKVVDATTQGSTLVNIGGKPYALNIPLPVHAGQLLNLQVSQVQPTLQFRLLTPSGVTTPQSQDLGSFHPDVGALPFPADPAQTRVAPGPSGIDPSHSMVGAKETRVASEWSPGVPLVSTMEMADTADLGSALALQIKRQFENQAPAPPPTVTRPNTTNPATRPGPGNEGAFDGAVPPSVGFAPVANRPESAVHGAALAQNSSSPAFFPSDTASSRPNPVASALEPAAWCGHVWSGQTASITIEPDQREAPFEAPALNRWNATLKLTLPHLGRINAKVDWSTPGLTIRIAASETTSADLLRQRSSELLSSLRSLEMRVQAIGVTHGE